MINFEWCRTGRNPHIFFSISLLKRCGLGNQAIKRTAQVSYVLNPPLFHHIDRMKFSAGKYQMMDKVVRSKKRMDELDEWMMYGIGSMDVGYLTQPGFWHEHFPRSTQLAPFQMLDTTLVCRITCLAATLYSRRREAVFYATSTQALNIQHAVHDMCHLFDLIFDFHYVSLIWITRCLNCKAQHSLFVS